MARVEAASTWKIWKGYVDTPEGQVHYHRCGSDGAHPLILLHQWPDGATQWDPMLPVLAAKGFLAIALDMPMFGQSYKPEEEPDLGGFAEGVLAAVQALGYQGPMDYVGHHSEVPGWPCG
ncbi:hypothetical protein KFL_000550150 [Klebsormidium nitens]|uniref:AB hydrolase-1 domain-containing protein n=1 Tax=Klebsormidium nitens TaxID=105231 RepID=A0A1Y1HPC1_KLENI|nr:hypothetical protein KFL_000550150 [Klebsormidium nitens]|eukprot:GAQ80484.1 hypothetical protein KFL_000550150 [Klebsormidium nitens]